jgi:hypothetical protein
MQRLIEQAETIKAAGCAGCSAVMAISLLLSSSSIMSCSPPSSVPVQARGSGYLRLAFDGGIISAWQTEGLVRGRRN